jgi:hypothetical protein
MVTKKQLIIEYCPTTEMIADMFTKPLPPIPFTKHRKKLMNIVTKESQQSQARKEAAKRYRRGGVLAGAHRPSRTAPPPLDHPKDK